MRKAIPYYDPVLNRTIRPITSNAYKMQYYLSDIFPQAQSFQVLVVPRDNFIPLKNPSGKPIASPEWVIQQVTRQNFWQLYQAGALLDFHGCNEQLLHRLPSYVLAENADEMIRKEWEVDEREHWGGLVEISPLLSAQGEKLEVLNGVRVKLPCIVKDEKEMMIDWKNEQLWECVSDSVYCLEEKDGEFHQYIIRTGKEVKK